MDTRGYEYPPNDDLLKRHNGNNGDLAREGLDAGEALGADGFSRSRAKEMLAVVSS